LKPTFIGIGAQKCASGWVYQVLQDHPEAVVSDPKELNFFTYYYDRGYQWYESFFAGAGHAQAVGENSPSYFYDPLAPTRAFRYNPDFRIVVTLRDPVERAFSNHLHEVHAGHIGGPDLSFERGFANNEMYLYQSRYATHLKHWLRVFAREQILILLQEEIADDPRGSAKKLYVFLGISASHQSEFQNKRVNESADVHSRSLDTLFKAAGRAARRIGQAGMIKAAKENPLIAKIRETNKRDLRQVVPPMLPATRAMLVRELTGELIELANLLGRSSFPWPTWQEIKALERPRVVKDTVLVDV